MNPELQSAIGQGAALKHAETVDKSAPQIENVTVKKVDRSSFLEEVAKPHDLKHAETVDKSGPAIPGTLGSTVPSFIYSRLLFFLSPCRAPLRSLYTPSGSVSHHLLSFSLFLSISNSFISLATEDVHVKKVDRGAFLSEIEKAAKQ